MLFFDTEPEIELCFSPPHIKSVLRNLEKLLENYNIYKVTKFIGLRNCTKWNSLNLRNWKKCRSLTQIAEFSIVYYTQPHPSMALAVLTECIISAKMTNCFKRCSWCQVDSHYLLVPYQWLFVLFFKITDRFYYIAKKA